MRTAVRPPTPAGGQRPDPADGRPQGLRHLVHDGCPRRRADRQQLRQERRRALRGGQAQYADGMLLTIDVSAMMPRAEFDARMEALIAASQAVLLHLAVIFFQASWRTATQQATVAAASPSQTTPGTVWPDCRRDRRQAASSHGTPTRETHMIALVVSLQIHEHKLDAFLDAIKENLNGRSATRSAATISTSPRTARTSAAFHLLRAVPRRGSGGGAPRRTALCRMAQGGQRMRRCWQPGEHLMQPEIPPPSRPAVESTRQTTQPDDTS